MPVSGTQPVSVADLATAMQSASTGGIGGMPVSVDDLKMVFGAIGCQVLYDGPATKSAALSRDKDGFDVIVCIIEDGVGACIGAPNAYEYNPPYAGPVYITTPRASGINTSLNFSYSDGVLHSGEFDVTKVIGINV